MAVFGQELIIWKTDGKSAFHQIPLKPRPVVVLSAVGLHAGWLTAGVIQVRLVWCGRGSALLGIPGCGMVAWRGASFLLIHPAAVWIAVRTLRGWFISGFHYDPEAPVSWRSAPALWEVFQAPPLLLAMRYGCASNS